MAPLQWKLIQNDTPVAERPERQPVKHKWDQLNAARIAKHLVMFQPDDKVVEDLVAKARLKIPGLTETANILDVRHYNPDLMFAFARKSKFDPAEPVGEAFIAILPLNMLGLQHLALGTFNAAKPDKRLLAKPNERPAGIYLWCAFAPGPLAASVALLLEHLSSRQYAGLDVYARTVTEDGARFCEVLGFVRGFSVGEIESQNLWVFSRKPELPLYDSYVPHAGKDVIGITVVRTIEDMMRVAAVRNAVCIGEQECPYDEEHDGNDLSATHLLAYVGDEPVGCVRLRFFADFAKLERLAVRKEFRKTHTASQLVRAGIKFCQKKGYRSVYAHSQTRLVNFWSRFGFRVMEDARKFAFSDYEYIEMIADIEHDPDAISPASDPYVIIRPEGRWHAPGVLEQSAVRAISHPVTEKRR